MAQSNSTLVKTSRYVSGGTSEVNATAIEWWERNQFRLSNDDRKYVVEKKWVGRLDLIAAAFLGEPRHWWVIAQYNNILDPHNEIIEGRVIFIPTIDRVNSLLNGQIGGQPSQREVPISILPIV